MIVVENNGAEIASTDFFKSELARGGYIYVTVNAGCLRLLIPAAADKKKFSIKEMKTGKVALVSRGLMQSRDGSRDVFEILFEDYTDNPFVIFFGVEQIDIAPGGEDVPGEPPKWKLAVYTERGKEFEIPARFRKVTSIPFLKEWAGK